MDILSMIPGPLRRQAMKGIKKQMAKENMKMITLSYDHSKAQDEDSEEELVINIHPVDIVEENKQLKAELAGWKLKEKRLNFLEKFYDKAMAK